MKKSITVRKKSPAHPTRKGQKLKKVATPRSTIAGKIRAIASEDAFEAMLFAQRGKQFSAVEHNLQRYYVFLDEFNRTKTGENSVIKTLSKISAKPKEFIQRQIRSNQKNFEYETDELCKYFIRCVNERRSDRIFEIAKAINFLKTFKNPPNQHYRADLLSYKFILDRRNGRWPIKTVAQAIGWPKIKSQDGLSDLRRLCKELKFPLAPTRKISSCPSASKS